MEASSALSFSSKSHFLVNPSYSFSPLSYRRPFFPFSQNPPPKLRKTLTFSSSSKNSPPLSPPLSPLNAVAEVFEATADSSDRPRGSFVKIDKSGRFCSPRAARELALLIAYAACLEGSDPVFLFDKRVNAKRVPGYVFDKASLLQYDHMSFGGDPVQVDTEEAAKVLMEKNENDSVIEAEVLSAPPKLVYNKFVLRLARDMLGAVVNHWNQHVIVIDKIIPPNWKDEPAARILELCILHLAMAEISALGTRHQIVINEVNHPQLTTSSLFSLLIRQLWLHFPLMKAVDLAKRFCDGSAPRIINGCLRTFIKDHTRIDSISLHL